MKTITITCDDDVATDIQTMLAPYPVKKLTIVHEGRRKRTVSVGQRQHRAAPQLDEGKGDKVR